MNVIKELKDTMDNLQVASLNYIEKMPIYDMFYDQIEKVKRPILYFEFLITVYVLILAENLSLQREIMGKHTKISTRTGS